LKKEKQAAAAPQPRVVRRLSDFISSNWSVCTSLPFVVPRRNLAFELPNLSLACRLPLCELEVCNNLCNSCSMQYAVQLFMGVC
jgi:hypothetical protein